MAFLLYTYLLLAIVTFIGYVISTWFATTDPEQKDELERFYTSNKNNNNTSN